MRISIAKQHAAWFRTIAGRTGRRMTACIPIIISGWRPCRGLMRLVGARTRVAENYFDDKIDRHISASTSSLPGAKGAPLPGQFACWPHTDYGTVTI